MGKMFSSLFLWVLFLCLPFNELCISAGAAVPVANAGPDQSVVVSDTVSLNGSASSDSDGDPLTYLWSFIVRPPGSAAVFSSQTSVNPTFTADQPGAYVIQLIVNDGTDDSTPDTITITALSCTPPPSNMVSWWPGDNSAIDIQGSNDGTLIDGATFAPGVVDQAFSFDGVNDYVTVPDNSSLNPSVITVDAWFSAADITGQLYPPIVKKAGANAGYALEIDSGTSHLKFWVYVSGIGWRSSTAVPISINTLYHAAGTYDGSNIIIYLNGQPQGSPTVVSGSIASSSNPLNIGRDPSNTSRFFEGYIDEVEIFNRALSAAEIAAIYAAGIAGKCKPDADSDGVTDAMDNCPNTPNPNQQDSNHNGIGDACENGPDLTGYWKGFSYPPNFVPSKILSGRVMVSNTGNSIAKSFVVSYYLSNDGQSLDTLLRKSTAWPLNPGRTTGLYFWYFARTPLSGKYLIAVIDSANQVNETNETNNRAVQLIP